MTSNATQDTKPLTPPDRERCQAEITTTPSPFTMGGDLSPTTERCAQKPRHLLTELTPGPDGRCGAMTLCDECLQVFKEQTPGWSDRVRVGAIPPVSDRIRLPEAFKSLLAEAAAEIDLTVSWSQRAVRYDAAGLHDSDLWFCKGQAGPVGVDDRSKGMDVRAATFDVIGRMIDNASYVMSDAESDDKRAKRRDLKMKAVNRFQKARRAWQVLTALNGRAAAAWPEEAPAAPTTA